jgi:hypothetical protein
MTTATKPKRNWRELVAILAGRTEKNLEGYGDLVNRLASGEQFDEGAVERCLNLAGKSADDLTADVARKTQRLAWQGEIERLEALALEGEAADREKSRLIQQHNQQVESMVKALEEIVAPLRMKSAEASSASSMANDLRTKLLNGADAELLEQADRVHTELRQALANESRLRDRVQTMRPQVERAEQEQLDGAAGSRRELDNLRVRLDEASKRVRELRQQSEDLTAVMGAA